MTIKEPELLVAMFGILERLDKRTVVLEPLVKEFNGLNDEVEVSMIIDQFLSLSF